MVKRLQEINGDTVLEITHEAPLKTRLSEKTLLRQKQYLLDSIATFQRTLTEVEASLSLINEERNAQAK